MKSLLKIEAVFGLLLVLSLGGKIVVNGSDGSLVDDGPKFALAVSQTLNEQGFDTKANFWPTGPEVEARREGCFMWVRDYTPHGTMKNIVIALAQPVGKLRYSYLGKISKDPPKIVPLIRFFGRREVARLGKVGPRYPIYALAVNSACPLEQIRLPKEV